MNANQWLGQKACVSKSSNPKPCFEQYEYGQIGLIWGEGSLMKQSRGRLLFSSHVHDKTNQHQAFLKIPPHSTDGHEEGQYFLCQGIPYPKKTNRKSDLHASHPIVQLCCWLTPDCVRFKDLVCFTCPFKLASSVELTANATADISGWKCSIGHYL